MKPKKTPKPTAQDEIDRLQKRVIKLTGDLAMKRKIEELKAQEAGLQKALKAEPAPCDKPHYPPPCPLPHSPWFVQPWSVLHGLNCQCGTCRAPRWYTTTNPIITCTDGLGTVSVFNSNNLKGYEIGGSTPVRAHAGPVRILNTGTQATVASTPTFAIGESEN